MKFRMEWLLVFLVVSPFTMGDVIAINFMGRGNTPVTQAAFGVALGDWTNVDTPDAPSIGTNVVDGVTITYSAVNDWRQGPSPVTTGEDEVMFGYLDDGSNPGPTVEITVTGLSSWLSSVGATEYTFTLLAASDGTVRDGAQLYDTSTGGDLLHTFALTPVAVSNGRSAGIDEATGLDSDALFFDGIGRSGGLRGSVAGFIIEATVIPEPSSLPLLLVAGFVLFRRLGGTKRLSR